MPIILKAGIVSTISPPTFNLNLRENSNADCMCSLCTWLWIHKNVLYIENVLYIVYYISLEIIHTLPVSAAHVQSSKNNRFADIT